VWLCQADTPLLLEDDEELSTSDYNQGYCLKDVDYELDVH
jgi:hypothetical protein